MANTIVYRYDPKQSKVVAVKIDCEDPERLSVLSQVAKLHVPIVEAMKKSSTWFAESVDLDLPSLPVVLRVFDVVPLDQCCKSE